MFIKITLAVAALALVSAAQLPANVGKVDRVVLYRGQALVTRSIAVSAKDRLVEVLIENLPERVVSPSLFAEASEGAEVRAVRYREVPLAAAGTEALRELEERAEALQDQINRAERTKSLAESEINSLASLHGFVVPTAHGDLGKGVLNAEVLERLITFGAERRKALTGEILDTEVEIRRLRRELDAIVRERAARAPAGPKLRREALVYLEKTTEGPVQLQLSYLVDACGWSALYNLRGATGDSKVAIEANAVIQQMSGEEWDQVELVLSTATPGMNAQVPALSPFNVAMIGGLSTNPYRSEDLTIAAGRMKDIRARQELANIAMFNAASFGANLQSNWALNNLAVECQTMELNEDKSLLQAASERAESEEGPSVSYRLSGRVSLASRHDQQLVRIAKLSLPGRHYFVASPLLSDWVFREASVANQSELDLLGGEANAYLDGRFVGKTEIPSIARGQRFVIGFGADPQLRTSRTQVDRTETVQGGNKVTKLTYRLTLENFKSEAVEILLQDRVPHADQKETLRVTLAEMDGTLSDDPDYLRIERPMGILRWNRKVEANALGDKAHLFQFAYSLEHDRNLTIGVPSAESSKKAQQEFETLLKQRAAR